MKEGRMKGQAFITLPSDNKAKKALREVHGYILHGKPMVIVSLLICSVYQRKVVLKAMWN
jgi:RNA recognition motif-containing protein